MYPLQIIYFQVYGVATTIRGEIKTHARAIVLANYAVNPPPNPEQPELSEHEKKSRTKKVVASLVVKGGWAHAPASGPVGFFIFVQANLL